MTTANRSSDDEVDDDYIPLEIPPDSSSRHHRITLMIGLLALLLSATILALAEILLRNDYDRFTWGIVWFAALGVLIATLVWWCAVGRKPLRRFVRHRMRKRLH